MILFALMMIQAAPVPLPKDVAAYIDRRQDCEHWSGEEPYDAERRREIEQAVAKTCKGIDKAAAKLRSTHSRDARVLAELDKYPPMNN